MHLNESVTKGFGIVSALPTGDKGFIISNQAVI